MFRFSSALAVLVLLCPLAFAQNAKTVRGHLIGEAGPHPVSTLGADHSVEFCSPAIPFLVPKWDGTNDEGQVVPWFHLRRVEITIRHALTTYAGGENSSSSAADLWVVETGTRSFWSRAADPDQEHGGASFNAYLAGGESLAPFDGAADGSGPSGWSATTNGTPFAFESIPIGANREDVRAWAGAGDQVLVWRPEQFTVARGFPGHWRQWNTTTVRVLDVNPGYPGFEIEVRYVLGPPPFAGSFGIEAGPWVDHGILAADELALLDLAGAEDPSNLIASAFEYASETGVWIGLENLSTISATCGGSRNAGVRIEVAGGAPLAGLWSSSGGNVGTFAPIASFDGGIDWRGASGRETWSGSAWTMVRASSWPMFSPSIFDGDLTLVARVTHAVLAPESVTPGGSFAWDGEHLLTGRTRSLRFVRR